MIFANFTPKDWKTIRKLIGKKDRLKAAVAVIDRQLNCFEPGSAAEVTPRKLRRVAKRKKTRKAAPGSRQSKIIAALKSAGPQGMRIRDLAKKLKTTQGNIRNWFYTTGKKVKEIGKAGPGRYRWV